MEAKVKARYGMTGEDMEMAATAVRTHAQAHAKAVEELRELEGANECKQDSSSWRSKMAFLGVMGI
jgi:phosphopantetheine adenylyltransferase